MLIARHSITDEDYDMISSDGAARVEDTIAYPACRYTILHHIRSKEAGCWMIGTHVAAEQVGGRWSLQNVYFSVKIPQRA